MNAVKAPHELFRDELKQLFEVSEYALQAGQLLPADEVQLRRSEADLRVFASHLSSLIESLEEDGLFGEALALKNAIWGSILSAASIGQFAATTESAKAFFRGEYRTDAREAKARLDAKRAEDQKRILKQVIGDRSINQHTKFVDGHLPQLNAAAKAAGLVAPGRNTWIARMNELGYRSRRRESKTVVLD